MAIQADMIGVGAQGVSPAEGDAHIDATGIGVGAQGVQAWPAGLIVGTRLRAYSGPGEALVVAGVVVGAELGVAGGRGTAVATAAQGALHADAVALGACGVTGLSASVLLDASLSSYGGRGRTLVLSLPRIATLDVTLQDIIILDVRLVD